MKNLGFLVGTFLLVVTGIAGAADMRGTGDLGIVVERAAGRVQVIELDHADEPRQHPGTR